MNRYVRILAEFVERQRDKETWVAYPSDEVYEAAAHVLGKKHKHDAAVLATGAVYRAVMARAGGQCEAWHHACYAWRRCGRTAFVMDHWLGGNGRRKAMESVETCWALCDRCNADRTANRPTAAYWNESHRQFAEKHGYEHTPHITHQPVPAR